MTQPDFVTTLQRPAVGSTVTVDVILGQAQRCEYTVKLYDAKGENGELIGDGNNFDPEPDSWNVKNNAPGLAGRLMGWTITIASPADPVGQFYSAEIVVREGNTPLSAARIVYRDPLDGAKILIGFAKFA